MTFLELYGEALSHELGSDDTTQLFTTARRKSAINEAQDEFNRQTECFQKRATIALSDGTAEYDLEGSFTDFLWLGKDDVEVLHNDGTNDTWYSGPDLPRRDIPWLNRHEPGWRQASAGTPRMYYLREHGGNVYLGFYPAPDVEVGHTWTAYVTYVADPPDMSADGDEPYTLSSNVLIRLRPWHKALVHFAAGKLESLRRNYAVEDRQRQLFAAYIADYLQKQRRKGGQFVSLAREYRRSESERPPDPYRWP